MTTRRTVVVVGAVIWAALGAAVALSSLSEVNADARAVVMVASVAGPVAALGGAALAYDGRDRWAGLLLMLSALTPTYYAWVLNVPALLVGACLVAAPKNLIGKSTNVSGPRQANSLRG